jgi:hypothetical protein
LLKKMKLVRDLVRVGAKLSLIFNYWIFLNIVYFILNAKELAKQIDDYTVTYDPDDQLEWSLVLSEIKSFIEVLRTLTQFLKEIMNQFNWNLFNYLILKADNIVTVVDMDNIPLVISHRLSPSNTPPMEKVLSSHLTLQEILIVGNCSDQVWVTIFYIYFD